MSFLPVHNVALVRLLFFLISITETLSLFFTLAGLSKFCHYSLCQTYKFPHSSSHVKTDYSLCSFIAYAHTSFSFQMFLTYGVCEFENRRISDKTVIFCILRHKRHFFKNALFWVEYLVRINYRWKSNAWIQGKMDGICRTDQTWFEEIASERRRTGDMELGLSDEEFQGDQSQSFEWRNRTDTSA